VKERKGIFLHYLKTLFQLQRSKYREMLMKGSKNFLQDFCGHGSAGNFSLRHRVQTVSRVHPAYYPMGTGITWLGRQVDHSPAFSAVFISHGAIPPFSNIF
jgi:hypothetical protein